MKKVKVLVVMPFVKVEEVISPETVSCVPGEYWKIGRSRYDIGEIEVLVEDGFVEWIEEPKSLEEKFNDIFDSNHQAHASAEYWKSAVKAQILRIAKEHYLEAVDKTFKVREVSTVSDYVAKLIRKAVEEA